MCEGDGYNRVTGEEIISNADGDVTGKVRRFYELYQFPSVRPPDQDGLILMRRMTKRLSGRDGGETVRRRVLDAGCGTGNTSVSLAKQHSNVDFLGVDISSPSLSIAKKAAQKAGLRNIRFQKWDLMKPGLDDEPFDFILCLGVLHHTQNMGQVLTNLKNVMKDDGEFYLWVYGRHGRYRHSLNRCLLDMLLSVKPDSADPVELARDFALSTGGGNVLSDLFGDSLSDSAKEKIIKEPAWIADQFLNPHETLIEMRELLDLVFTTGFEIDRWLGVAESVSRYISSPELVERFELLPKREQLIALDLMLKPDRYFVTLRKGTNGRGDEG